MAQGDAHLNADGTLALDAGGAARLHDADDTCPECCGGCTTGSATCINCDDLVPDQYDVTFAGITLCGCTTAAFAGVDIRLAWNTNLNGTFRLSQTNQCIWFTTITGGVQRTFYEENNETCATVAVGSPANIDVLITLTRTATEWQVLAYAQEGAVFYYLFFGTVTANTSGADQLCATVPGASSVYVVGDCGEIPAGAKDPLGIGDAILAHSGSSTVVCV